MPLIPFNDWCNEDDYMFEMARMHKLKPKLDVVEVLKDSFDKLANEPSYKPDVQDDQRKWLRVELSAQIVALSMELTDDLAFVCEAYLKSLANGDKRVVEHIANLQRQDAQDFYEGVAKDGDRAVEALGLDVSTTSREVKEGYRDLFENIRQTRNHFWPWYNGYKHGQYATPIVVDGGTPQEKWGLYLIPRTFERRDGNLHTKGEERFIDTVRFVEEFVRLAKIAVELWLETVRRQFPKVFQRPLA